MKSIFNLIILSIFLVTAASGQSKKNDPADLNKKLIASAFDNWKNGKGSVFDLLDEKVTWIVAGSSPVSATYHSKKELMEVVKQINTKLSGPIIPEVQQIIAQDSVVVVLWQGKAPRTNGKVYSNTYSWHMTIKERKIVRVTAFLDTYLLAELLQK